MHGARHKRRCTVRSETKRMHGAAKKKRVHWKRRDDEPREELQGAFNLTKQSQGGDREKDRKVRRRSTRTVQKSTIPRRNDEATRQKRTCDKSSWRQVSGIKLRQKLATFEKVELRQKDDSELRQMKKRKLRQKLTAFEWHKAATTAFATAFARNCRVAKTEKSSDICFHLATSKAVAHSKLLRQAFLSLFDFALCSMECLRQFFSDVANG
ncbi:unnamed protein product [Bursaphelenchus okinawaensis]|uniref:Uncharacterized protein n=1 Tax=Bursaphelenchus okinawaensis TaxID=465554 RepID=A0A811JRT8_9BILA|nr:unnamed protein product [Bursaphelenchus okinawaensis]CAG9080288.1 unnamed protein product [Bursaphelenchus okinawaensis]